MAPVAVPGADTESTPMPNGVPTNPLIPSALQAPPSAGAGSAAAPTDQMPNPMLPAAGEPALSPAAPVAPPPPLGDDVPGVAPSAYHGATSANPPVAVAEYDPRTGRYLAPDGQIRKQANLVKSGPESWKDLVLQS